MTNKAYIVANKEQELYVLNKFEAKDLVWFSGDKPTEGITNEGDLFKSLIGFPYVLIEVVYVSWSSIYQITDEEIVYDGRKEENMYKVTQEFMNELIKWRENEDLNATSGKIWKYINDYDLAKLPSAAQVWRFDDKDPIERNNRLIAIIQWLNGEGVFKVEEQHKFVVRSEHTDKSGDYVYVTLFEGLVLPTEYKFAYIFDTREEAQEWANSHQVVVEIDAEGNEVE